MHTPLLLAGGHAPALGSRLPPPAPGPPSVSFRGALQLGGPAPSSLALPSRGGGGARSFSPGSTGTPPPSRACLMLLGRRGLVSAEPQALVSRSGKKGGGYRAILRNRLIQEPRLPFNPTGRHCLKWEEQSEGGERLASPEGLVWSLKLPSGIAPFPLRGRPAQVHPRAPSPPTPHRLLDCLNSLSWFQEANLSFPHLGIGGKVFLWKSFRREKENSESRHVVVCVGTGSFGPPRPAPPPSALITSGHTSSLDSLLSPPPLRVTQIPLPTVTVFSGRNKHVGTQLGG